MSRHTTEGTRQKAEGGSQGPQAGRRQAPGARRGDVRGRAVMMVLPLALLAWLPLAAGAQPATEDVEVEPLTCWWRTSASEVRVAQPFTVVLTCSVLETQAVRTIVDRARLAPSAVQLSPFEILGGSQSEDVTLPGRRFLQYEYRLRLIDERVFGADVPLPRLEVPYRLESRVQDSAVQGLEQVYVMPALSMHIASLVPADATHIREAPVPTLNEIAARETRGGMLRVVGAVLVGVGGFALVLAFVRLAAGTRKAAGAPRERQLGARAALAAATRELRAVGAASVREGWNEPLLARALTALRVAGSVAAGQPLAERRGAGPLGAGQLAVRAGWLPGAPRHVSGAATPELLDAVPGSAAAQELKRAIATLTAARYGRPDEVRDERLPDALEAGLRATALVAGRHTWFATALRSMREAAVTWRGRAWAR